MIRFVYIEQFGQWWRLPYASWMALVRKVTEGQSYDLDEEMGSVALVERPRYIASTGGDKPGYFTTNKTILIKQPLGWTQEDFVQELRELEP